MHPSVYNTRSRNKQKNVGRNYRAISRRDEKPTQMNVNVQTSWASLGGSGSRWITSINKARAANTAGWGLSSVRVLVIVLHVCRVCAASTVGPAVTVAQVKDTNCSPAVCWSAASLQTPDRTGWYWIFCPVFSQFNIEIYILSLTLKNLKMSFLRFLPHWHSGVGWNEVLLCVIPLCHRTSTVIKLSQFKGNKQSWSISQIITVSVKSPVKSSPADSSVLLAEIFTSFSCVVCLCSQKQLESCSFCLYLLTVNKLSLLTVGQINSY